MEFEDFFAFEVASLFARHRPPWYYESLCLGVGNENFFAGQGGAAVVAAAKELCLDCPHQHDCFVYAYEENADEHGVWGGSSRPERLDWFERGLDVHEAWNELMASAHEEPSEDEDEATEE